MVRFDLLEYPIQLYLASFDFRTTNNVTIFCAADLVFQWYFQDVSVA